jgi:hypothetical protein
VESRYAGLVVSGLYQADLAYNIFRDLSSLLYRIKLRITRAKARSCARDTPQRRGDQEDVSPIECNLIDPWGPGRITLPKVRIRVHIGAGIEHIIHMDTGVFGSEVYERDY